MCNLFLSFRRFNATKRTKVNEIASLTKEKERLEGEKQDLEQQLANMHQDYATHKQVC